MKPWPLNPPADCAERDRASRIWTAAQDIMVARGYGRELWGNWKGCAQEFVILIIRETLKANGPRQAGAITTKSAIGNPQSAIGKAVPK